MNADERTEALRDLIELREPIPSAISRLRQFPWDSDTELVAVGRNDLIRILDKYLAGELVDAQVEEWAGALEGRDDVGYEFHPGGALKQIIFELANPLLTTPLEPARACNWKETLGRMEPDR
jgi:hypothetical protein